MRTGTSGRGFARFVAFLITITLVAAACGSGSGGGGEGGETPRGGGDEGTPVRGGELTYALEAESAGGYCLAEAQLAIAGIQVARAIYDTLTAPNADGEIEPYLAESVEPNGDYTEWTITLREGVKFHDGTDLTAEVVKNNLDAYRGVYPARSPLLFRFVFSDIDTVEVVDPLRVKVTTKRPWTAFAWYLWGSGRIGMMAQAQLDDAETCATRPIGTGGFEFVEWRVNDQLVVERFDGYWQMGADGQPLPYLDRIVFRPQPDGAQRVNALDGDEIGAMHASAGQDVTPLRQLAEAGEIGLIDSDAFTEVNYLMFNQSKPPFDSKAARLAVAHATNRQQLIDIIGQGVETAATGPFAPGNIGHLDDTGMPAFDVAKAREFVAQYEAETGGPLAVTYSTTPTPVSTQTAQLLTQMWEAAGISVSIKQVEQAQLINDAIAGNFEALGWRNHPGGDPDTQYVWWHSGSSGTNAVANPINFGRINDPEIDALLDAGRVESDPGRRQEIYENLNRRFASEMHNLWTSWTVWAVGTATNVHGVLGPDLPSGSAPFPGLATGHPVVGMWVEQ